MSNKKGLPFPFIIVAIIVGCAIYKQFDFKTLKFENTALAIIYILTFLLSVFVLVRSIVRNREEK